MLVSFTVPALRQAVFNQSASEVRLWNQSVLILCAPSLDPETLAGAENLGQSRQLAGSVSWYPVVRGRRQLLSC